MSTTCRKRPQQQHSSGSLGDNKGSSSYRHTFPDKTPAILAHSPRRCRISIKNAVRTVQPLPFISLRNSSGEYSSPSGSSSRPIGDSTDSSLSHSRQNLPRWCRVGMHLVRANIRRRRALPHMNKRRLETSSPAGVHRPNCGNATIFIQDIHYEQRRLLLRVRFVPSVVTSSFAAIFTESRRMTSAQAESRCCGRCCQLVTLPFNKQSNTGPATTAAAPTTMLMMSRLPVRFEWSQIE